MTIPPLSQSRYEDMACATGYREKHVFGHRSPTNVYAQLGTEIHRILSTYIRHLVKTSRNADWKFFDELLENASPDANDILRNFRERYTIDPTTVYATEKHLKMDDPESEGTLDLILLPSPEHAQIDDFKNYFAIVDLEKEPTFQSRLYPLLLMAYNPAIEKVTFRLVFTRYGTSRSIVYTRADMPKLLEMARAARARQLALHVPDAVVEATPGSHCLYCPLLAKGCPIERNPYGTMTPEERLARATFLSQAAKENTAILKSIVKERGKIEVKDANGSITTAQMKLKQTRKLPLLQFLDANENWMDADGQDLRPLAFVSRTELKAIRSNKSFATFDQALKDRELVKETTSMAITTAGEDSKEEE